MLKSVRPIVDDYYKHFFKSHYFIPRLAVAIIGIRDGKQISYDDFASIRVPYPPLPEQRRIADVLATCDRETALLEQKRDLLKQQKRGLMQQLLTGRVRV